MGKSFLFSPIYRSAMSKLQEIEDLEPNLHSHDAVGTLIPGYIFHEDIRNLV
jgi:hypothetical protein